MQREGLRRSNVRAVLTAIGFNQGVFNAEIARMCGLAPQTVSAILIDLDRAGLIERGAVLRGRRGQPATPIFLRPTGAYAMGVEIGWRHLDLLIIDLQANVVSHRHFSHDFPDARTLPDQIAKQAREMIAELPEDAQARLRDIGVAMPMNIGNNSSVPHNTPEQSELWRGMDLAQELRDRSGLDISLLNDGNAACWAELIAFESPRPANAIYLLISTYIAAGIVAEGTLWTGPTGNSANLGAMLVQTGQNAPQIVHFTASVSALMARLQEAGHDLDLSHSDSWDWERIDAVVSPWIFDSAAALARVVYNTSTVIEAELVVLDTILPQPISERLAERVAVDLADLPSRDSVPGVVTGKLGRLAPAIGAAELPLFRRHFSRGPATTLG